MSVAGAIAHINRRISEGDCQNTLEAMQVPSAGLRAVLSECADTYQSELAQKQANPCNEGDLKCHYHYHNLRET